MGALQDQPLVLYLVDIVLDAREEINTDPSQTIELQYPPIYIFVRIIRTKVEASKGWNVVCFQTKSQSPDNNRYPCVRVHRLSFPSPNNHRSRHASDRKTDL